MNVFEAEPDRNAGVSAVATEPQPGMQALSSGVFTLRQSGCRPVSFAGRHLAHTNGYRVGIPLWHELNLYQTDEGQFVADIHVYAKAQGAKDQFHVNVADSLEEALAFFEDYQPKLDVTADFEIDDASLAPAELLVHAAALKYRIADTVNQYKAVLSSFLKDLSNV